MNSNVVFQDYNLKQVHEILQDFVRNQRKYLHVHYNRTLNEFKNSLSPDYLLESMLLSNRNLTQQEVCCQ